MITDAGRAQMQANKQRAADSQAAYRQEEHARNLEGLRVGDWVLTSWFKGEQARAGIVVDVDRRPTFDGRYVTVFEAHPTPRGDDLPPCDLCGQLAGQRWYGEAFTVPDADLVEIHPADNTHRQWAAKKILRVVADWSYGWTRQDTRRTLTALAIVEGHEAAK